MRVGTLVKDGRHVGVVKDIEIDDDNGELLYEVVFNNGWVQWFYDGYLEVLCE